MVTGNFTVTTKADPRAVAAYLSDFRHQADWRDDVLSSQVESGTPGDDGAVYSQHVRQGPGTATRQIEAHISSDDRSVASQTVAFQTVAFRTLGDAPVLAAGETTITATAGGSTVDCTIEISFKGTGNVLRPVVGQVMNRRMTEYRAALTRELDNLAIHDVN